MIDPKNFSKQTIFVTKRKNLNIKLDPTLKVLNVKNFQDIQYAARM
jgi:hypothetical protein